MEINPVKYVERFREDVPNEGYVELEIVRKPTWIKGDGKFIQLDGGGKLFLRLSDSSDLHSRILEDFLEEVKIDFEYERSPGGLMVPARAGERYSLVGAGGYRVGDGTGELEDARFISFFGDSATYGSGPDKGHLDSMRGYFPRHELVITPGDPEVLRGYWEDERKRGELLERQTGEVVNWSRGSGKDESDSAGEVDLF